MHRAYLAIDADTLPGKSDSELLGELAGRLPFALEPAQRTAWIYQIRHLREIAGDLVGACFFMEFLIPRMGRRADLVIILNGIVFVVEYKVGASQFDRASLEQVYGYGLDLKNFHESSHSLPIIPILVATESERQGTQTVYWGDDFLARAVRSSGPDLSRTILEIGARFDFDPIDPNSWVLGRYRPTPTIIEAAQALYGGHQVEDISRSESGAENLSRTSDYVTRAIETAKNSKQKVICFVTGVPGSGKTLAGLNLATSRQRTHKDEHAVFLSGNGPLVDVLREALAIDAYLRVERAEPNRSKDQARRKADTFIQNIHHFRDEALRSDLAPVEKVAIFDEAQRAWDVEQTSKFMRQKRGQLGFSMSEPEFLLSVMDRHVDWCAVVCLVGGGQEINTGEAGIEEWLRALERSFSHWQVHLPVTLIHSCKLSELVTTTDLHLATSIRSFRAERLSEFVKHLIVGEAESSRQIANDLKDYPIRVTRDLEVARDWLRTRQRGNERIGLLASSNANRLKPNGVFVKAKIDPTKWFLAPSGDVRSSNALEDVATEFDIQGLELDWACLCWDANYRRHQDRWVGLQFKGSAWQLANDDSRKTFIANSYRVLLTRARQGLIIFVPEGSAEDATRSPRFYDGIYQYLIDCGIEPITSDQ